MRVIELASQQEDELRTFLSKDPVHHLYALGVLEEHGLSSGPDAEVTGYGLTDEGGLQGAVVIGGQGGLVLLCCDRTAAIELGKELQDKVRTRAVLGERNAVEAFVRSVGCNTPRESRPQRLFAASADDLGPFVSQGLRLATPADVNELVELNVSAIKETTGEDFKTKTKSEAELRLRVEARVADSRTYLLMEGTRILVKVDIGPKSAYGAEIEGLFTVPSARYRGNATLALGQLSRKLLSSIPRLTMRMDEQAACLAAVCRKVGYVPKRPQKLVIVG